MCHSFIVGDLVIDHTIFVRDTTAHHQQMESENIFQVLRRTDSAGGAANCARILAVLSDGETYLWGITGKSLWGEFRLILSHSQERDGSTKSIEFRGVVDETGAKMNTISRLLLCNDDGEPIKFGPRFDEDHLLHVAPEKHKSIRHYLDRAQQKLYDAHKRLDVIIINDLDYACLTQEIVRDVATFAHDNGIPLFVDPKYDSGKYADVKGKAILPNLREWCDLVGEQHKLKQWRDNIAGDRSLDQFAYRCFLHFPHFEYYLITCDRDGVVFIGPHPDAKYRGQYAICHIPAHKLIGDDPIEQLAPGDVLSAVFAMEFDRIVRDPEERDTSETARTLKALIRANVATACYRRMSWHRMPSRQFVSRELAKALKDQKYNPTSSSWVGVPISEAQAGIKYLPRTSTIILSEHKTIVPGWFSDNLDFCKTLSELRDHCISAPYQYHAIVGGPSGSGKTTGVRDGLIAPEAAVSRIELVKVSDEKDLTGSADKILDSFKSPSTQRKNLRIFVIDEALKRGFKEKSFALKWFNAATERSIRIVLIDTGFFHNHPWNDPHNHDDVELIRRSKNFILSAPNERPGDIPLTIAALIFRDVPNVKTIKLRGDFLLAFTNFLLEQPSTGQLGKAISSVMQALLRTIAAARTLELTGFHVPDTIRLQYLKGDSAEVAGWSKKRSGEKEERWYTFERGEEAPGSENAPIKRTRPRNIA